MAEIALLSRDLMFASRLEVPLRAAGHEVTRHDDVRSADRADVLVIDLDQFDPALIADTSGARVGFYPHIEPELRRRAVDAGFDVVVPRSRIAREPAAVIERVLA